MRVCRRPDICRICICKEGKALYQESDRAWLAAPVNGEPDFTSPAEAAKWELRQGSVKLGIHEVPELYLEPEMDEAYEITGSGIRGGRTGILQGVFRYLECRACGYDLPSGVQRPRYALRMMNCWDNLDGSVERGYSGPSIWFRNGNLEYDRAMLWQTARMLASSGINVLCINNVNVLEPAQELIGDLLPAVAELARNFRMYGIRLMLSVDFSQPIREGLATADPLDPQVRAWWHKRADMVYAQIPDLAGFLVKADSEHRPGPFIYGRNHADGANMLAEALAPHGGVLVWRAFVYNCQQDWRDVMTDRPKAAYDTYMPLDGRFADNVILQVKHGPFDFQVREPVSPLLLAMKHTRLCMEVQLAQEYTGQQIDLYAMNPMWHEIMQEIPEENLCAVAAVGNLGRGFFLTGHPMAAVNLYGFGRFGWNPGADPEHVIRTWVHLSFSLPAEQEQKLTELLMHSREVYENYTATLGLNWMITPAQHYGPNPMGYEYQAWGTYHRSDRNATGIDRTINGTGYTRQYPEALCRKYENLDTCPERLLLFFHRLPYTYVMQDGRTLIQRIYDDHFLGCEQTRAMQMVLEELSLPERVAEETRNRMARQVRNAREWCDIVNSFFYRYCGIPDARGRVIYS